MHWMQQSKQGPSRLICGPQQHISVLHHPDQCSASGALSYLLPCVERNTTLQDICSLGNEASVHPEEVVCVVSAVPAVSGSFPAPNM